ncbi:hypothetical protein CGZ95_18640 [Enemella evansiae]|uniref:hypothetical protein n=1 Tax=Enemella evansiae TaxID=2016499 RepID=UPI000B975622|nr:hypothetical protein [Enemella evansiae]OYN93382.1 hypothetical protein CGZ95_18640 [Enemella evansiae]
MEDLIGPLLLILGGLAVLFFVLWILLATVLRIFAWVVFYWAVSFSLGAVAGLVTGFILPFLVLSGRASVRPELASPEEVVAGEVIPYGPRGWLKHLPWDSAWPVYNYFQAIRDARAVRAYFRVILSKLWSQLTRGVRKSDHDSAAPDASGGSATDKARGIGKSVFVSLPGILWGAIAPVPYFGFFLGSWISFAIWYLIMMAIGSLVFLGQQAATVAHRWFDRGRLRHARASVRCPHCYSESPWAFYRCSNEDCDRLHTMLNPGPLGVFGRRCGCGIRLPSTIRAAAKVLAPVCPKCLEGLVEGSGARHTVQLASFGAVGAGKTRMFAAGLVAMEDRLSELGGSLAPLTTAAGGMLDAARQAIGTGTATDKTIYVVRPEGQPLLVTDPDGRQLELQIMDASGETFMGMSGTAELTHFNSARSMMYILDPLAFDRSRQELARAGQGVFVAEGDQETAYASVVDRLRDENVKLKARSLAVVLTKFDVLSTLPSGATLDPASSDTVREWLISQDQDGFVRRIESDFGTIRYFAVDSLRERAVMDPLNPLQVFHWALRSQKVKLPLVPPPKPQPKPAEIEESEEVSAS